MRAPPAQPPSPPQLLPAPQWAQRQPSLTRQALQRGTPRGLGCHQQAECAGQPQAAARAPLRTARRPRLPAPRPPRPCTPGLASPAGPLAARSGGARARAAPPSARGAVLLAVSAGAPVACAAASLARGGAPRRAPRAAAGRGARWALLAAGAALLLPLLQAHPRAPPCPCSALRPGCRLLLGRCGQWAEPRRCGGAAALRTWALWRPLRSPRRAGWRACWRTSPSEPG